MPPYQENPWNLRMLRILCDAMNTQVPCATQRALPRETMHNPRIQATIRDEDTTFTITPVSFSNPERVFLSDYWKWRNTIDPISLYFSLQEKELVVGVLDFVREGTTTTITIVPMANGGL